MQSKAIAMIEAGRAVVKSGRTDYADRVVCSNCGDVTLVVCGSETCPKCLSHGTLAWADEEGNPTIKHQEVRPGDEVVLWVDFE